MVWTAQTRAQQTGLISRKLHRGSKNDATRENAISSDCAYIVLKSTSLYLPDLFLARAESRIFSRFRGPPPDSHQKAGDLPRAKRSQPGSCKRRSTAFCSGPLGTRPARRSCCTGPAVSHHNSRTRNNARNGARKNAARSWRTVLRCAKRSERPQKEAHNVPMFVYVRRV